MSQAPETITVEVRVLTSPDDPPIKIYHANISTDDSEWLETFGSRSEIQAFLTGVRATLATTEYMAPLLNWTVPESWGDMGIRWKISRDSIHTAIMLDSRGEPSGLST